MSRTVVVLTRVGTRFGQGALPSEERVRWWARLASEVGAGGIPEDAYWVWQCAPEHFPLVASLAPARAFVSVQGVDEVADIPGDTFTVCRADADDRWFPSALDVDQLAALPEATLMSFPCGRQIDLPSGVGRALDYRAHFLPPFLAVTQEGRGDMLNVGGQHTAAARGRKVIEVLEPSWLQLTGDWNTANQPDKFGRDDRWPVKMVLLEAGMRHEDLAFDGELDRLAAKYGTDKGSAPGRGLFPKRYTRVYEQLLDRSRPYRLLELGVHGGASIRMWLEWLPDAKVAGVDLRDCPNDLLREPRYRHFKGAQADPALLTEAVGWLGGLDCWIDDCSHKHPDHVASHAILWPWLSPGGWAAIEDLHATPASVPWIEGLGGALHADGRLGLLAKPTP